MKQDIEQLLGHTAWIRRLARRLVSDAALADDLVQETWIAALSRPPDDDRPARPWLARVLSNLARNERRSERRRGDHESAAARSEDVPSSESVVARVDTQRALVEQVLALEEPHRSTVLSHYFDGLSAAEIARRDGLPAATVRARLRRGLELLRSRLDDSHGGRERWFLAFAPIFDAPIRGSVAYSLPGIGWIMSLNAVTKLSLSATLLAALALFVSSRFERDPLVPDVATHPDRNAVALNAPPGELVVVGEEVSVEDEESGTRRTPAPAPTAVAPAGATEPPAIARARFVDDRGLPLADVRLWTLHDAELERAVSDANGEVVLRIRPGATWPRSLSAGAPLRATVPYLCSSRFVVTRMIEGLAISGTETDLGDIELRRAGCVTGRVVDEHGLAVEGATVHSEATDRDTPGRDGAAVGTERRFIGYEPVGTRADGSFEISGVAPGFARITVRRVGYLEHESATIRVAARRVTHAGDLTLRDIDDSTVLQGFVRAPDAGPFARALVEWNSSTGSGEVRTDSGGRFLIAPETRIASAGEPVELRALDRDQRFGPSDIFEATLGASGVVLTLSEGRFVELQVRGSDGDAIEAFRWLFVSEEREVAGGSGFFPGGIVRSLAPRTAFHAEAQLHGYEIARSGVIDPDDLPARIELTLKRRPGLSGQVTFEGKPVRGARVRVLLPLDDHVALADGFWNTLDPQSGSLQFTDDEGRFHATPPARRVILRVRAEGFATALSGPHEVDLERGLGGLEIELSRGATLFGTVSVPHEVSARGLIVGACRGDGVVLTTRVDENGDYRFSHLAAGDWQVGLCPKERNPDLSTPSVERVPRTGTLEHDLELREGESVRHDLERRRDCRLNGRLTIENAPPGPFSLKLIRHDTEDVVSARLVDSSGSFEARVDTPGTYRMLIELGSETLTGTRIERTVELSRGHNEWTEDLDLNE